MTTASATFGTVEKGSRLLVCTAYPVLGGDVEQVIDEPVLLKMALASRSGMEDAYRDALQNGQGYPNEKGEVMRLSLGWDNGLPALLQANPSSVKLTFDAASCRLLPEVVPVDHDGGIRWLDRCFPTHRTLSDVDPPSVQRCRDMSLAILYQDQVEQFSSLADSIRRDLHDAIHVDTFPGSAVVQPDDSIRGLHPVFYEHRAVLFLGHLHRPRPDGTGGGWQLTREVPLKMEELGQLLGGGRARRPRHGQPRLVRGVRIPEVVFSSCCCGAWGDPDRPGQEGLFYPRVFLDAGVRFFVGAWMDVILSSEDEKTDLQVVRRLISQFFLRWAATPDGAVEALYEAKKGCGFHLLTSLYQIYSGIEQRVSGERPGPTAALVSGLKAGDRMGAYVLSPEVWADQYARTFWARNETSESNHLVQVLVDEWQDNRELLSSLDVAVRKLGEAGLGERHLTPSRHDLVMWSRDSRELRDLHILVYDRPPNETAADWCALPSRRFDRSPPGHFMEVLRLGAEISMLLAELHGKQLMHGNLDPGSIVFLKAPGSDRPATLMKDAWVRLVSPARYTGPLYVAPEEPRQEEAGPNQFKWDCWSLGILLFETATGKPPFEGVVSGAPRLGPSIREAVGDDGAHVPEALERAVRDCLSPAASVRPSADLVAKRLLLALATAGTYVSDLEQTLDDHVRAGYRLFFFRADEMRDLEAVLVGLASHPRRGRKYRLYEAAENLGLVDRGSGRVLQPWVTQEDLFQALAYEAQRARQATPRRPTLDEVAGFNARFILEKAVNEPASPDFMPIIFIRGAGWWCSGWADDRLAAVRWLKHCQEKRGPAIVVGDRYFTMDEDLFRYFQVSLFPPLSPSELFERILATPGSDNLGVPEVEVEAAIELAGKLFPCSSREVTDVLRLCALKHGRIDNRVVEIRDDVRAEQFRRIGTATYTPPSRLADPSRFGLPPALEPEVSGWVHATLAAGGGGVSGGGPRRLLISGPSGYGKSRLAETLAKWVERPLVRIEANRCLRGEIGGSESALREALLAANSLGNAVVLLDDVDRFFGLPPGEGGSSGLAGALARMSGIVLNWLDNIPETVVAVLTATNVEDLPAQWRWRVQLRLPLDSPVRLDGDDSAALAYRGAVFSALLRKAGLEHLAQNASLVNGVARGTHPRLRAAPLPSPCARRCPGSSLGKETVFLETPADVESWIMETIHLACANGDDDAPASASFWLEASQY